MYKITELQMMALRLGLGLRTSFSDFVKIIEETRQQLKDNEWNSNDKANMLTDYT